MSRDILKRFLLAMYYVLAAREGEKSFYAYGEDR